MSLRNLEHHDSVDEDMSGEGKLGSDGGTPSRGFLWSGSMLALMVLEALALVEGFVRDSSAGWADLMDSWLGIYLVVHAIETIILVLGILLVAAGQYRIGGILQISCSVVHVPTGIIGVIGGLKAYRYPGS